MKISKKLLISGFLATALGWYIWQTKFKDDYYFNKFMELCPEFMAARYEEATNPTPENVKRFTTLHKKLFKYCYYSNDKLEEQGYVYNFFDNIFGRIENIKKINAGGLEIKIIEFRETPAIKPINKIAGFQNKNKVYLNLTKIEEVSNKEEMNDHKTTILLHEIYHLLDPPTEIYHELLPHSKIIPGKTIIYSSPQKELGAELFAIIYAPNQKVSDITLEQASISASTYIEFDSADKMIKEFKKRGISIKKIANMRFEEMIKKAKEYGINAQISTDHNVLASKMLFDEFRNRGISLEELFKMDYRKRSELAQKIYKELGYNIELKTKVF